MKHNIPARNRLYNRKMLPDRIAVKTIIEIADEVLPYGLTRGYLTEDYQGSLRLLKAEILKLKHQANQYHELKKILRQTVS